MKLLQTVGEVGAWVLINYPVLSVVVILVLLFGTGVWSAYGLAKTSRRYGR